MPEIITCPACQRRLNLPESVMGQLVKCPSCGHTFTAAVTTSPPPAPAPRYDRPPPPRGYDRPPPRHDDRDCPPRRHDDEDYERPERPRYRDEDYDGRYARPHRGALILVLGLLGLTLSPTCVLGWVLGGYAISMGDADLQAMRRGTMDPAGQGITVAGRVCGIIGVVIATIIFLFTCLIRLGSR